MPEQRSADVIQINLRLTRELHKRLTSEAKKAGCSLNQEMIERLKHSFERDAADELLAQADVRYSAVAGQLGLPKLGNLYGLLAPADKIGKPMKEGKKK
jgi:hypothetical protein